MDQLEFNTHSFVVKVWREGAEDDHEEGQWRGHITHVPSGERRYLKGLGGIAAFILPYLASMGVRLGAFWRLRSWFSDDAGAVRREPQRAVRLEE